jgi:intron-binding protein aquarius
MFNSTERLVDDDVKGTEMAGVEHLGQYVFEMTQAKIQQLKKDGAKMPPPAAIGGADQVGEAFGDSGDEGDILDDDVGDEGEEDGNDGEDPENPDL